MTIEFKLLGSVLHTRFDAASIREKIYLAWREGNSLVLDFNKIEMMSHSFADECFGKLAEDMHIAPFELYNKFEFKNTSPIIKKKIDSALNESQSKLLQIAD